MTDSKLKVLVLIDHYIPGFRFGGPLRTVYNMTERLGDEIDFLVITRDRDLGEEKPYPDVTINAWNTVGKAKVFYAGEECLSFAGLKRLMSTTDHDVLYLNSFFSPVFTVLPLLVRMFSRHYAKPIILAPRGEFSPGALKIKRYKKGIYLTLSGLLGVYKNICFQASSDIERNNIAKKLGAMAGDIIVAPDLVLPNRKNPTEGVKKQVREPGPLRLIFVSRISPIKNLKYVLQILGKRNTQIDLSIFGPIEDLAYWTECIEIIQNLPSNICVQYKGELDPEQVQDTFAQFDLFVFPSLGENFGHVIYESLSAGTAVLTSDRTPWTADEAGAVTTLPLDRTDLWLAEIDKWGSLNEPALAQYRFTALKYANDYLLNSKAIQQNKGLFAHVLKREQASH